jgi:hypothetical protein
MDLCSQKRIAISDGRNYFLGRIPMNKEEAQKRLQDAGFDRHQAAMIVATIELAMSEFKIERLKFFTSLLIRLTWILIGLGFLWLAFEAGKHAHP